MSRTPEQVAADDALTDALAQANRAYYPDDEPAILTDYVFVYVRQRFDPEDGAQITEVGIAPRDGDLATYRSIGLLDYALTRLRQRLQQDDD